MKTIGFVLCYMGGHLHGYFDKFLLSCKYNPTIDWLLFTDDRTSFDYPENVKVHYTTMDALRKRAREALGCRVRIDTPRGLCNYKLMYGQIFEEELDGYDFWGYCDCDLLWGDMRSFLTDDILEKYGKVGIYGHMTLMKNDAFHREIWREAAGAFRQWMGVDILNEGDRAWSFDETPGIDRYFEEHGLPQYGERIMESYQPDKAGFLPDARKNYERGRKRLANRKNCKKWRIRKHIIFEYDCGKIYRICLIYGKIHREEICYAHFPGGKKFENRAKGDHFYIIPYAFIENAELTPQWLRTHSEEEHLMQSLRLSFIWYRGVAAKYLPGPARFVKGLMGRG